eukprot:scaffold12738_cov81-Phaeocystis_antarctica.AAC.6
MDATPARSGARQSPLRWPAAPESSPPPRAPAPPPAKCRPVGPAATRRLSAPVLWPPPSAPSPPSSRSIP